MKHLSVEASVSVPGQGVDYRDELPVGTVGLVFLEELLPARVVGRLHVRVVDGLQAVGRALEDGLGDAVFVYNYLSSPPSFFLKRGFEILSEFPEGLPVSDCLVYRASDILKNIHPCDVSHGEGLGVGFPQGVSPVPGKRVALGAEVFHRRLRGKLEGEGEIHGLFSLSLPRHSRLPTPAL